MPSPTARTHGSCGRRAPGQRGAALLLAMMIVGLVTTIAAAMVWQQQRAITVEAAERARAQSSWILLGALDWARLILREDARSNNGPLPFDSLDEPWATPLAEARLSTFLAADKDNNADTGPEAFISGAIVDAQSRFNLRNLVTADGKPNPTQVEALKRLADNAGAPTDTAARITAGLVASLALGGGDSRGGPIRPATVSDLAWLGIDAATLERLRPYVELLPAVTTVNANTASREVLVAAIDNLDLGSAERLVQARQRQPFKSLDALKAQLPAAAASSAGLETRVGVGSNWFEVTGRLRLEDRVVEERSLLERVPQSQQVVVRRSERRSLAADAPPGGG